MTFSNRTKAIFASKLEELFGLDLRSLALFRIGLALVIIADLIIRGEALEAHYTDYGVLPRPAAIDRILHPWYWSVHLLSGQPLVQGILFLFAFLVALALLVGYQTKLATIVSWALVVSLHNRNPVLIFTGDNVLRAVLFWAMFLPLGACYSVDSALNSSTKKLPQRILSVATLALTLQICFVYIFSVAFKAQSPVWWWPEGSAVYYALSFDHYVTELGQFLLNFPPLLVFFTYVAFVLEGVGPLFLFVPFRTGFFRCCTIVAFILLHIGLELTMNLGLVQVLSIVIWLVFIPSEVWELVSKFLYTSERVGLKIYYDGDCSFCQKVVHLMRTFLILPMTPLLVAQDEPSIFADMQKKNSWVVVDWQDRRHFKFEALAYLCCLSPLFRPLAPVLEWKPIISVGTKFYEIIASNRRIAGKFTKSEEAPSFHGGVSLTPPMKFRPVKVGSSRTMNLVMLLLLAYVTVWNLRSLAPKTFRRRTLDSVDWISRLLRLDQKWDIFAPPPRDDGWYVLPGKLKDGTAIDVFKGGGSVDWKKPSVRLRNAIYRNMQWRTYFINLNRSIGKKLYPYYGQYLCRDWNSRHKGSKQLDSFEIYLMSEKTVPPGHLQEVEKTRTWQQSCSKKPVKSNWQ